MEFLSVLFGMGLGMYILIIQAQLYLVNQKIKSIPTTEEIALEIVNTKIPVSKLSPDALEAVKTMTDEELKKQNSNQKPNYFG